ncbi:hypothetical protein [Rugamonas sp.]|uniref:hypothetical protein n=1 Tax=Rugamonas sp. TaxID=1926287 RepID=UPI0025CD196F|nr:hypothetical protein [Rugamonas sp.]
MLAATVLAATALSACSPTFDWRDYRSNDAPYTVLFPAKPVQQTRTIDLDGQQVSMTMAAAVVDGTSFAVGSAEVADPAHAQIAVLAMKTAMVKNIGGTVTLDKVSGGQQTTIAIEARGSQNGKPMLLAGHFVAKDKRIYQVIVMARGKQVSQDTVDTFISSFKLN